MNREYITYYSNALGKDMHILIHGHDGLPLLMFPTQNSMCENYEDFGMVRELSGYIEAGQVQLFTPDTVDIESWSDKDGDKQRRAERQEQYFHFITDEMVRAMTLACKRGVDVRIITPGIPDKKITYRITRSNYRVLVNRGVRIYEYTPGFSHAKMCVSDAETAIIGTINLDYRSLYLNFENGVFLYDVKAIHDIYEDFMKMFEQSQEVTKEYEGDAPMLLRTWNALLRLMAPLF